MVSASGWCCTKSRQLLFRMFGSFFKQHGWSIGNTGWRDRGYSKLLRLSNKKLESQKAAIICIQTSEKNSQHIFPKWCFVSIVLAEIHIPKHQRNNKHDIDPSCQGSSRKIGPAPRPLGATGIVWKPRETETTQGRCNCRISIATPKKQSCWLNKNDVFCAAILSTWIPLLKACNVTSTVIQILPDILETTGGKSQQCSVPWTELNWTFLKWSEVDQPHQLQFFAEAYTEAGWVALGFFSLR